MLIWGLRDTPCFLPYSYNFFLVTANTLKGKYSSFLGLFSLPEGVLESILP